ncbi:hypothetical protein ABZ153_28240 [Streptomyces sp. NPDC006290]|jgi:hypothetical protein|uniref:hypothetical protein n=1 Tax=Streptomyces sp. NPDC006290 TaxID=3156745 RepID=UPI0033A1441F
MIDAGGSTIELKLDAESGVVAECILVDARGVTRVDLPIALPPEIEDGIPVIEIGDPADEESPGGVYLHENGLDIRLSEGLIERGVRAGGVIFGFSAQRQLLGVAVRLGAADLHQLGEVIL